MDIPFYNRFHAPREALYVADCLEGNLETDGIYMDRLLNLAGELYPDRRLLFTPSCTLALEAALSCLHLQKGDEVLLPSFNFPSAANAVLRHGGIPVLCDISPDTQNLSVRDAARRINGHTRAIIAVHYAGVACPMEELAALAGSAGLVLIEDAAQCAGARYQEEPLGCIGDLGCISFHHTKNITCGEGGLLITGNEDAWQYARQYRLHGTNRAGYLDGESSRYTWNLPGSCAALSEPQAALLLAQLEALDLVTKKRVGILNQYLELLAPIEARGMARLMRIPPKAGPNGHIFYLRFESSGLCGRVRDGLLNAGIDCRTHYVPLHTSPMGKKLGYRDKDLPEALACGGTLLRLPIHAGITFEDAERIAETIQKLCLQGGTT